MIIDSELYHHASGEPIINYPTPRHAVTVAKASQHLLHFTGISLFILVGNRTHRTYKGHVRICQQTECLIQPVRQQLRHRICTCKLTTDRRALPHLRNRNKFHRCLRTGIGSALGNPRKPPLCIPRVACHVIIYTHPILRHIRKRSAHKKLCVRKCSQIRLHIFPQKLLGRKPFYTVIIFYMPLTPVSDASKLYKTEKRIHSISFPQRLDRLSMILNECPVGIVR